MLNVANSVGPDSSASVAPIAASSGTARAAYVTPVLRVHGDVATLTMRNWWAPGRQDGSNWFRRTG